MQLTFRGLTEDKPGAVWREVFQRGWPGWGAWYRARAEQKTPDLPQARRALRRYMPEFESLWDELVETAGADAEAAGFLSFWTPPHYLISCSQLVLSDADGPMLVRNYDLDPALNETTMLNSAWRGHRVMGMVEGMAGLVDGMNDMGVAASLTFGGRTRSGRGFGVPIIMRYLLEMCRDVDDAREVLRSVPCHMSYSVTVADRAGNWTTAFLAPDRPAILSERRLATNHQLGIEWPAHGRETRTQAREAHLEGMAETPELTGAEALGAFLRAPLFSSGYARGFGTVYTAAYRPATGEALLAWKNGPPLVWQIDDFQPKTADIVYSGEGSENVTAGDPACSALPESGPAAPRDPEHFDMSRTGKPV